MVTFKNGAVPAVSYLGVLNYPLYLSHQDLELLGIELRRPAIGQLAAALLLVLIAVAVAAVVGPIVVWLTKILRRTWPFWGGIDKIRFCVQRSFSEIKSLLCRRK